MKTLLIGKGHLGKILKRELSIPDELYWTDRISKLDEAKLEQLGPELIVNTAGKTDLTYCEQNRDECWNSNVIEPLHLYRRNLKTVRAKFLQISSGCIWDGPYDENGNPFGPYDPPTPACHYSWSKASFDALLRSENKTPVMILRPRQVYSEEFAKPGEPCRNTLQKLLGYKSLIDSPNSMTSAYTIAKTIKHWMNQTNWPFNQIMNVYDLGVSTPYKVGCLLAEAGLRKEPELTFKSELDKWHRPKRVDAVLRDYDFEMMIKPPLIEEELRRVILLFAKNI